MTRRQIWSALILASAALPVWGQSPDTQPSPSTAPATAPTSRRAAIKETPPPGFIRVTAGRYSAFCQPLDEGWVKQGLAEAKAKLLPSTRPSDIVQRIGDHRGAVVAGLAADLDVEPADVEAMLDEKLLPLLKKLDAVAPPVVFLVATDQKVKSMLNDGWTHPRIGYNRLMDALRWDDRIMLSLDAAMDEALMRASYEAADTPAERVRKLREAAEKFESEVAYSIAGRARKVVQLEIAAFIEGDVFAPLKLGDDQLWLQLGTMSYLAAKYAPMMTGEDSKQMLADMMFEPPNTPISASTINLLDLPDLGTINPQYKPFYIDAARRKATVAVQHLIEQAGPDAITKAIVAVKKQPPKDAADMVSRVMAATTVDLTKLLQP